LEGVAHHDLFHICAETGEIRKAYNHAVSARAAYGEAEEYLGRLAADLANFWIHLGRFSRAVPIYEALVTLPCWDQTARAFLAASLVRASALVQARDKYEEARTYAMEIVPKTLIPSILVECYVLVAAGDLAMKEWHRAEESATFALARAHAIGATEMEFRAEEILGHSRRQIAPPDGSVTLKFESSIETPGLERMADSLAKELLVAVDA
jgi:tetratricopeptide (TPR) repeat protein